MQYVWLYDSPTYLPVPVPYSVLVDIPHQPITQQPNSCDRTMSFQWFQLMTGSYVKALLGGGFKDLLCSPLFGEDSIRFPFWLIFFRWVETTNQSYFGWWLISTVCKSCCFCSSYMGGLFDLDDPSPGAAPGERERPAAGRAAWSNGTSAPKIWV